MKWRLLKWGIVATLAGCGGASTRLSFPQIQAQLIEPNCTFSVCHAGGPRAAGAMDLAADPYKALVGVVSDNAKAKAEGLLRVKPGDAASSFLVTKLMLPESETDATKNYGAHMPQDNPSMTGPEIATIVDWINRGALPDEPGTVAK
jgi:hypothetical protein